MILSYLAKLCGCITCLKAKNGILKNRKDASMKEDEEMAYNVLTTTL